MDKGVDVNGKDIVLLGRFNNVAYTLQYDDSNRPNWVFYEFQPAVRSTDQGTWVPMAFIRADTENPPTMHTLMDFYSNLRDRTAHGSLCQRGSRQVA